LINKLRITNPQIKRVGEFLEKSLGFRPLIFI
jgi:hypothetical protein